MKNSKKYVCRNKQQNGYFGGDICGNVLKEYMSHFLGIMLNISIGKIPLSGYTSYFQENISVVLASGYVVPFTGYEAWVQDTISLQCSKQVREELSPKFDKSTCGDTCHQIHYSIKTLNDTENYCSISGPNIGFNEGGVAMCSHLCPF